MDSTRLPICSLLYGLIIEEDGLLKTVETWTFNKQDAVREWRRGRKSQGSYFLIKRDTKMINSLICGEIKLTLPVLILSTPMFQPWVDGATAPRLGPGDAVSRMSRSEETPPATA